MADFDRVNGTAPDLDRAQRRIQEGQKRGNPPFQEGAELSFSITSGSPRTVAHKLGRKARGFTVLSERGDGTGSLQSLSLGSRGIDFDLKVPSGAPATTIEYTVWVY